MCVQMDEERNVRVVSTSGGKVNITHLKFQFVFTPTQEHEKFRIFMSHLFKSSESIILPVKISFVFDCLLFIIFSLCGTPSGGSASLPLPLYSPLLYSATIGPISCLIYLLFHLSRALRTYNFTYVITYLPTCSSTYRLSYLSFYLPNTLLTYCFT